MTSKRLADERRADAPRRCDYTKAFLKDWHRLARSGRYDMKRLKEVMLLLISGDAPLGREWLDHALTGNWALHRECHVGGDFLLIYRIDATFDPEQIVFVRAGTHSELFG
jgi:mRNA interferase YafQ